MPRTDEPSTRPQVALRVQAAPSSTSSERRRSNDAPERLGRYEVLFELARGGMGVVYVGRLVGAHGFDRLVAIKCLSRRHLGADDVAAFLREARLTARIGHPNVVETFELGEHDGAPFIVMQLVQGVSLASVVARLAERDDALDADLCAWVVAQAAAGLHAAHELTSLDGTPSGLVHRDVSPQNLLCSFDGRVYVADFGVAKLLGNERATQSGIIKGKFGYMSPEQTRDGPLDRRSDVFSLGIVMYEALTGRGLFDVGGAAESIRRIAEHHPPNPHDVRETVPEALGSIVLRCLAKRADDRYASAAELADALRAHVRSRGALADESELASLLGRVFGDERDALRGRIRSAVLGTGEQGAPPPVTENHVSHGSVTAAVGVAGPPVSRRLLGSSIVAIGIVGAAFAFVWSRGTRESPPASPSASSSPAVTVTQPTAERSVTEPTPALDAIATAEAPQPSVSATARAARDGTGGKRGAPLPEAPLHAPTATAVPASAPAASTSHRGVPFRELAP